MAYEKYTRVIELMNLVPVFDYSEPGSLTEDKLEATHKAWDELYEFIYPNFPEPASAGPLTKYDVLSAEGKEEVNGVYELLTKHKQDELLARLLKLPPDYVDVIFPVAIARYLLCYKQLSIGIKKLKTWTEFNRRYANSILQSLQA